MTSPAKAVCALVLASLGACGSSTPFIAKEYMWVQKEDGMAMKAPITYRVRYHWAKDTLYWSENVTDVRGVQDLQNSKYATGALITLLQDCKYFDDDNWSCTTRDMSQGNVILAQTMKDGKLSWYYWGDQREMKTRYLIWNKPISF